MANYYCVDDFLASETLFPTVFECGSTRTKELLRVQAVGTNQIDVERDAKADLPLWLCETLHKHSLATVQRPNFLGERIQRRLTAGAACENLRARCLYYYSAASQFCALDTADVAVAKAVFSSFRERFTKLAEFALAMSSHCQDKLELIQNLSLEELFLYEGTSAAAYQAQAWCFDHDVNTAEFQKR